MQKPETPQKYHWGQLTLYIPRGGELMLYERYLAGEYDSLKIRPSDVVLDAGAYVGDFTVKAAKKAREVIAVEPIPRNFELLKKNVEANGLKNVTLVNKALWKEPGMLKLADEGFASHIASEGVVVEAVTVDDMLAELGRSVSVVKMDIEGAEKYALKGKYINHVREIAMELHGENAKEIPPYLEQLGFKVEYFGNNQLAMRTAKNALLHMPSLLDAETKSSWFALRNALRFISLHGKLLIFSPDSPLRVVYARKRAVQ
ncbi:FkbM family methyltransferase [Tardisphaera saccharovorans]